MKFLFLMDPLETIVFEKDTTFMLMLGAHERGHEVYYVAKDGLSLVEGTVIFQCLKVTPQRIAHEPFLEGKSLRLTSDDIDAVFIRPDPPFNENYLLNTWLLDHLPKRIAFINSPSGIRSVNEKIWSAQFTRFVPPTVVSSSQDELLNFIKKHKNVIAKPTNAFGGKSVFHLNNKHTNTNVILETLSKGYAEAIIVQKYIPEAENGDKRILLLNGDILGAVLRVHAEGEHRNNFYAGGTAQKTTITARDKKIVGALKPYLRDLGLYFVGIDILGDYLIEVNVTSPTCLQEMNRLYDENLEKKK